MCTRVNASENILFEDEAQLLRIKSSFFSPDVGVCYCVPSRRRFQFVRSINENGTPRETRGQIDAFVEKRELLYNARTITQIILDDVT